MLFLSRLVGTPVLDRDGGIFGKVRDLIVALGEQYPPVTGVVMRVAGGRGDLPALDDVEEFDGERRAPARPRRDRHRRSSGSGPTRFGL